MKKLIKALIITVSLFLLTSCNTENLDDDKIKIVSSFTIITNVLEEIGEDKVLIHNLVPTGTDPHDYEITPRDKKFAENADVFIYNGMNLEGGENGWFMKFIKGLDNKNNKIYNVSEGIKPLYLDDNKNDQDLINPHTFISPKNGIIMVENILNILLDIDPSNKEFYESNANDYLNELRNIDKEYELKFSSIEENERIIVTSERAYQYLANDYNIKEAYIWAIDTGEVGTSSQINKLVEFIKENNVKVLFLESNVKESPMKTVSNETGVKIYKDKVYSDEIGKKGDKVDTYFKYLNHNLEVFINGLKGE